jgi:hypothetical protein
LACGFLGVSELEEDVGFGAPVADLAEDRLCVLVVADGFARAPVAVVRLGEMLKGVGVLPSVAALFESGYGLLTQAKGGLEGSEAFVDSAEPGQ